MQIEAILQRIDLDNSKTYEANLENLKLLMKNFLLTVPYENLDFKLNRGFSVNILKIYEKLIDNNRGGVCYETNTLFSYLIKTLGYKVQMIFANVVDETNIASNYPHLALIVELDGFDYLVDVGMGVGPHEPLKIDDEAHIIYSEGKEFKIRSASTLYALLEKNSDGETITKYTFTKEPKRVADFSYIFTQEEYEKYSKAAPLLVTKALKNGRVTIYDTQISIREDDKKRSWDISSENKTEVLRDYFNITF